MIWFTSDEHIGHRNIIEFCKRPFADLTEMNTKLSLNHNAVVCEDDTVYHLGDMFWKTYGVDNAIAYMNQLNGSHIYVRGNHEEVFDQAGRTQTLQQYFGSIHERLQIYPEGAPKKGIVLDHYAGRVWHDSDKGAWQLYGHTHAQLPEIDPYLSLDVGVDANSFYPVSLDEVCKRMMAKINRISRNLGISIKKG